MISTLLHLLRLLARGAAHSRGRPASRTRRSVSRWRRQDQATGARALRALAGFEIKPDDVGRDELAFAASLTDQQLERLLGRDAALLPTSEALERGSRPPVAGPGSS